ncbi:hypothetical protein F0562_018990 [Nyssa sinensis]|uniref:CobW/HypB/UreG nucleotide-binding domain-containing protein n=1 Tax=Nyssa sinensis TaxID=561372 RepID=A0A5J4ZBZ1_9ASTE|nr:hypothetical protein F0562_018990 [Nyssa sinensis]
MVATLLSLGAKPNLVTDPTLEIPGGCTGADLGSKKGYDGLAETTLLNHILTSKHGKRIAIIENEAWIQIVRSYYQQLVGFPVNSMGEEIQKDMTPPSTLMEHSPLAVFVNERKTDV